MDLLPARAGAAPDRPVSSGGQPAAVARRPGDVDFHLPRLRAALAGATAGGVCGAAGAGAGADPRARPADRAPGGHARALPQRRAARAGQRRGADGAAADFAAVGGNFEHLRHRDGAVAHGRVAPKPPAVADGGAARGQARRAGRILARALAGERAGPAHGRPDAEPDGAGRRHRVDAQSLRAGGARRAERGRGSAAIARGAARAAGLGEGDVAVFRDVLHGRGSLPAAGQRAVPAADRHGAPHVADEHGARARVRPRRTRAGHRRRAGAGAGGADAHDHGAIAPLERAFLQLVPHVHAAADAPAVCVHGGQRQLRRRPAHGGERPARLGAGRARGAGADALRRHGLRPALRPAAAADAHRQRQVVGELLRPAGKRGTADVVLRRGAGRRAARALARPVARAGAERPLPRLRVVVGVDVRVPDAGAVSGAGARLPAVGEREVLPLRAAAARASGAGVGRVGERVLRARQRAELPLQGARLCGAGPAAGHGQRARALAVQQLSRAGGRAARGDAQPAQTRGARAAGAARIFRRARLHPRAHGRRRADRALRDGAPSGHEPAGGVQRAVRRSGAAVVFRRPRHARARNIAVRAAAAGRAGAAAARRTAGRKGAPPRPAGLCGRGHGHRRRSPALRAALQRHVLPRRIGGRAELRALARAERLPPRHARRPRRRAGRAAGDGRFLRPTAAGHGRGRAVALYGARSAVHRPARGRDRRADADRARPRQRRGARADALVPAWDRRHGAVRVRGRARAVGGLCQPPGVRAAGLSERAAARRAAAAPPRPRREAGGVAVRRVRPAGHVAGRGAGAGVAARGARGAERAGAHSAGHAVARALCARRGRA